MCATFKHIVEVIIGTIKEVCEDELRRGIREIGYTWYPNDIYVILQGIRRHKSKYEIFDQKATAYEISVILGEGIAHADAQDKIRAMRKNGFVRRLVVLEREEWWLFSRRYPTENYVRLKYNGDPDEGKLDESVSEFFYKGKAVTQANRWFRSDYVNALSKHAKYMAELSHRRKEKNSSNPRRGRWPGKLVGPFKPWEFYELTPLGRRIALASVFKVCREQHSPNCDECEACKNLLGKGDRPPCSPTH